jgi:aspartyl-tRNA(Asn)/glutamyl-tRNA(Gln) amidotransferase subunit C
MPISRNDVEYVARLARLDLTPQEKIIFEKELGSILTYIDQLNESDTEEVAPTSHLLTLKNVFREDKLLTSLPQATALANAPSKKDGFFRVPRVIG